MESKLTLVELLNQFSYTSTNLLGVVDLMNAKFIDLSINGTEEEVKFWMGEHIKLVDPLLAEDGTLLDCLIAHAVLSSPLEFIKQAAHKYNLDQELIKVEALMNSLELDKEYKDNRRRGDNIVVMHSHYSLMGISQNDVMLQQVREIDQVVVPSSTPSRYADHSFFSRIASLAFILVWAMIVTGLWIYFYAKEPKMRSVARHALASLKMIDGVLVIGFGVLMPCLLYTSDAADE